MGSNPSRIFTTVFLIILILLAAYIRSDGVSPWHISPDEINHIEMAQGKTAGDIVRYSLFETHPPLGNLLRHYVMTVHNSVGSLRGLSLLFGLALIPLYYLIGALLAGPWAGICCAALAAFSYGGIIQSFVVRNYTILLFFLSGTLYAYLLWQRERRPLFLLLYGVLACAAVLTHFSCLFGIFCIALLESVLLLRSSHRWHLLAWLPVNVLIGMNGLVALHFWQPLLAYTRMQIHTLTGNPHDWLYPVMVMDYLFAYRPNAIYCFILFALVIYAMCITIQRIPSARIAAGLGFLALAVGSVLVISGAYQAGMTRTSLWLFPFLAPPVGCALGLACAKLASSLPKAAVASILLLLGWASYNQDARFRDVNEYMITEEEWSGYTHYLSSLDASHLIVATRSDAFLIAYPGPQNLYDYYAMPFFDSKGAFVPAEQTALVPYNQSQLLFKPYYFNYAEKDLIAIVKEAYEKGELAPIETLVFPSTLWSRNTAFNLILCPSLQKSVKYFPPLSGFPTQDELKHVHAVVLEVPKQEFLDMLAAPDGKARECLKGPPN